MLLNNFELNENFILLIKKYVNNEPAKRIGSNEIREYEEWNDRKYKGKEKPLSDR